MAHWRRPRSSEYGFPEDLEDVEEWVESPAGPVAIPVITKMAIPSPTITPPLTVENPREKKLALRTSSKNDVSDYESRLFLLFNVTKSGFIVGPYL